MNRLTSRKRITVALIGLIALVVIGWFVQQGAAAHGTAMPPVDIGVSPSPPARRRPC